MDRCDCSTLILKLFEIDPIRFACRKSMEISQIDIGLVGLNVDSPSKSDYETVRSLFDIGKIQH